MHSSLRARLLLLVAAVILPAALVVAATAWYGRAAEVARAEGEATAAAEDVARAHEATVDAAHGLLRALALVPSVAALGADGACGEYLETILAEDDRYSSLAVADGEGRVVCTATPETSPPHVVERAWFPRARGDGLFAATLVAGPDGAVDAEFAQPVLDDARDPVGAVFATMPASRILAAVDLAALPPEATVDVLVGAAPCAPHRAGEFASARALDAEGATVGSVCVLIPSSAVYAPADAAFARNLAVLGAAAVGALFAALILADAAVARPVRDLARSAQRLAGADRARDADELEEIRTAIETAASDLDRNRAEAASARASLSASEMRFAHFTNSSQDAFWTATPDLSRIIHVSPAFETVFGRSAADVVGRRFALSDLWHPSDAARVVAARADFCRSPRPCAIEYRVVRPDGGEREILERIAPIENERGEVVAVASVATDLTEARETERRARELDGMKTRFINAAAHELATPLTPMRVQLHVLGRSRALPDADRRAVEAVARNFRRLEAAIDDLVYLAALQSGRAIVVPTRAPVAAIARDAIAAARAVAPREDVEIAARVDESAALDADAPKLARALQAVLADAVRRAPRGGRVTVEATSDGAGMVALCVATPAGVDPDPAAPALHIASVVARGHGGSMWTESGSGASRVVIALPERALHERVALRVTSRSDEVQGEPGPDRAADRRIYDT